MKVFLLILTLFVGSSFAEKNKMMPLEDFVNKGFSEKPDGELLYLSYRCNGLYGMMYGLMLNAPQEGAKDVAKQMEEVQVKTIQIAQIFYNNLTPVKERDFEDNLVRSVMPMAENYQDIANESWTNTGSYFNEYILNDSKVCRTFVEKIFKPKK